MGYTIGADHGIKKDNAHQEVDHRAKNLHQHIKKQGRGRDGDGKIINGTVVQISSIEKEQPDFRIDKFTAVIFAN